ncbi:hypothetical protein TNCV_4285471 [Trichonephila clavipes]|nr:hypothetical protein TNCV_4285471 [Trichonephila clavipes]
MTNLGLKTLSVVPCYCHQSDMGGAEYHQPQQLPHHVAHHWSTHVLTETFLPTVVLYDNLVALHFKYDQARRRFVEWAQNDIASVPYFHKRILFSDEAHFWLNGYVNKQNCRIWSEANPQVYIETPIHPEKLTIWCALWAGGILLQKR